MAGRIVTTRSAALTANGSTSGYLTVAANVGFYPGTRAWLTQDAGGAPDIEVLITDLIGTTLIGVRQVRGSYQGPSYGRTDVSGYTLALNARLTTGEGVVQNPNDAALL